MELENASASIVIAFKYLEVPQRFTLGGSKNLRVIEIIFW